MIQLTLKKKIKNSVYGGKYCLLLFHLLFFGHKKDTRQLICDLLFSYSLFVLNFTLH